MEDYNDEIFDSHSKDSNILTQILSQQRQLEQQIKLLQKWLQTNNLQYYQQILTQQAQHYSQLQQQIKTVQTQYSQLRKKSKQKQKIELQIAKYDRQIREYEKALQEENDLEHEAYLKLKEYEGKAIKDKRKQIQGNKRKKNGNKCKIDYLVGKNQRVRREIEKEIQMISKYEREETKKEKKENGKQMWVNSHNKILQQFPNLPISTVKSEQLSQDLQSYRNHSIAISINLHTNSSKQCNSASIQSKYQKQEVLELQQQQINQFIDI